MKKPVEKEGKTKGGRVHREEIGNNKGLPKAGMVRANGRHRTGAAIGSRNEHHKTGMAKAPSDLPKTGKDRGSSALTKVGKDRGASGRTSLGEIARGKPTASKTLRKSGVPNPTGPHRERVVPMKKNK